jgi:hypothetical protein
VERNSVFAHQLNEVFRLITRQSRFAKMWIFRDEVVRSSTSVGEVAATTARNENLSADLCRVVKESNFATTLPGASGAHHARAASSNYDNIVLLHGHI